MPPVALAVSLTAVPAVTDVALIVELFVRPEAVVTVRVNVLETIFDVESLTRIATS